MAPAGFSETKGDDFAKDDEAVLSKTHGGNQSLQRGATGARSNDTTRR